MSGRSNQKTAGTDSPCINLKLRFKQDGGPLFSYLQSIEDPYARGERIRQLAYIGMLAERGILGGGAPLGFAVSKEAAVPTSPAPDKKAGTPKQPASSTADEVLQFQADDLSAIFGR
ncbi:MAG: hypothetical protein C0508_27195 [Cyanobacteria bacterium PR.023]|nr:hypothetical protein [Cyanobacteria bacterium PR.023]